MLENTEGAIKNGQSRETANIEYTRRSQTKQKRNTICVGHQWPLYTNNVNKTCALFISFCNINYRVIWSLMYVVKLEAHLSLHHIIICLLIHCLGSSKFVVSEKMLLIRIPVVKQCSVVSVNLDLQSTHWWNWWLVYEKNYLFISP